MFVSEGGGYLVARVMVREGATSIPLNPEAYPVH